MIPELYISVVSCFEIKVITKNMAVLYRFRDISSFKSEKGFIYKKKDKCLFG